MIKCFKRENGITLVTLAVTIVVLIILASIGIRLAISDNGIIKEAQNAKEQAAIDEEQSIVKRAITIALIKSKGDKIELSTLEKALNDEIGEGKTEVAGDSNGFEVMFTETNRYYEIDENGKIGEFQNFVKEDYAGDITKGGRCDGSKEKPYEIGCIEDLVVLANICNGVGIKFENGESVEVKRTDTFDGKYFILKKSLNFKSKYSYADSTRTDFGDINGDDTDGNMLITEMTTGTGFPGIGGIGPKHTKPFRGCFDGKEYCIYNIYINSENGVPQGLFSTLGGNACISNLTITGKIQANWVAGGIAGNSYNTKGVSIKNCINKVEVTGIQSVGGIIGNVTSVDIIENCENYGTITALSNSYSYGGAGGIVSYGGEIVSNCINYGKIIGYTANAGGIASGITNVVNCINMGDVSSERGAGGIIGYRSKLMQNCINTGNISGNKATGGIMPYISGGDWNAEVELRIENCANTGTITSKEDDAGGIIGAQSTLAAKVYLGIYNSWNSGDVKSKKIFGNILGSVYVLPAKCETKTEMYNVYCAGTAIGSGSLTGGEVTQITEAEINSKSFVDLLNSYKDDTGAYPTNWKKWKVGDEGYPIFED